MQDNDRHGRCNFEMSRKMSIIITAALEESLLEGGENIDCGTLMSNGSNSFEEPPPIGLREIYLTKEFTKFVL